ncbi:MAG: glycosyltransferase [Burkholderiales bacterium]
MRDDLRYASKRVRRLAGSSIKLINFCREAHAVFDERGQPSLSVTYWPTTSSMPERLRRKHPRIFLWDRGQVQWPLLKRLIGEQPIDGVVLRLAPDPKHESQMPSEEDVRRYRIEVVEGWLEKDAYRALLHGCDVFVAPRWLEGIGMAMLEAMAAGQAVLAPDRPTMNEYLVPGRNGWLFDPQQPAPIDLSDWQALGQQARLDCEAGAADWNRRKELILPFVMEPSPKRERLTWKLRAWMGR